VGNVLLGFLNSSMSMVLSQVIGVKLDWGLGKSFFFPLVWRQVSGSFSDSLEGGFSEVTEGGGATAGRGVAIGVSGVLKDLLWDWGGDDSGTSWGWNESHVYGTAFSVYFAWNGVWFTHDGTPETSSDRDDGELGDNDSRSDGVGDFFGAFDSETDVAVVVSDDDGGLEPGSLTGSGLFLNWLDFEDFVFQSGAQEVLDDFGLLDWEREGVNLSER